MLGGGNGEGEELMKIPSALPSSTPLEALLSKHTLPPAPCYRHRLGGVTVGYLDQRPQLTETRPSGWSVVEGGLGASSGTTSANTGLRNVAQHVR